MQGLWLQRKLRLRKLNWMSTSYNWVRTIWTKSMPSKWSMKNRYPGKRKNMKTACQITGSYVRGYNIICIVTCAWCLLYKAKSKKMFSFFIILDIENETPKVKFYLFHITSTSYMIFKYNYVIFELYCLDIVFWL